MKTLNVIFAIILLSTTCLANNNYSKKNQNHQLSYEEFINQYGIDDTSNALIDLFFDKRDGLGKGQVSLLPISTIVSVFIPPVGLGLLAFSSPLIVNGWITCNKYSKKKLLKTLIDYQNQDILSNNIKKKLDRVMEGDPKIFAPGFLEAQIYSLESDN